MFMLSLLASSEQKSCQSSFSKGEMLIFPLSLTIDCLELLFIPPQNSLQLGNSEVQLCLNTNKSILRVVMTMGTPSRSSPISGRRQGAKSGEKLFVSTLPNS